MKLLAIRLLSIALLAGTAGIVSADPWKDESGHGRGVGPPFETPGRHDDRRGTYFHERGHARLNIPPGHYPPPGQCRVWYPDRPPGHQPPPGNCGPPPPGAWLIRHPHDHPGHVHVTAYEPRHPRRVLAVGEFEIDSGAFVRLMFEQ